MGRGPGLLSSPVVQEEKHQGPFETTEPVWPYQGQSEEPVQFYSPTLMLLLPKHINTPHTSDARKDATCHLGAKKAKRGTIWLSCNPTSYQEM